MLKVLLPVMVLILILGVSGAIWWFMRKRRRARLLVEAEATLAKLREEEPVAKEKSGKLTEEAKKAKQKVEEIQKGKAQAENTLRQLC